MIGSPNPPSLFRFVRNVFLAACFGLALAAAGDEEAHNNKVLAACATHLDQAQTKHWLVVDLAQQIERALSYQPETDPTQFRRLEATVQDTNDRLEQARRLYKRIYNHEVENHAESLSQLLDVITAADENNEVTAIAVLTGLGQRSAGREFQALPVPDSDLRGTWDAKYIGGNFKPKRILFGSNAKAGDKRVSPLDFDFNKGLLDGSVPMTSPSQVKLPDSMATQTDPVYGWMKSTRTGYSYQAGIYDHQKTFVPAWFLAENEHDDDVWMRLQDDKFPKRGEWGQLNIWNRRVQEYLTGYAEAQGRALHNDPFLVCYDYTSNPQPYGAQSPGLPQYSGYNDSAVTAFRDRLQRKYKTINNLNRMWSSNYTSFESIHPPADPFVGAIEKATPLSYEFNGFRFESNTRLWKSIYDSYRRTDAFKPIVANAGRYMSGWPVEALDAYGLQRAGAADWIDMHMNNYSPNLPEQIYLYSLCRLTKKVPVQFEYVWTFPRTGPVDESNEADFRRTCEASVWRNLTWGKKALVFTDFYNDTPGYRNALLDREVDYSILRPSACVIPTTKRKALRFNEILMQTEVSTPDTIVLQPTTSIMNSPPLHPGQSFSYHTGLTMHGVHDFLFPKNIPFLYVPEEAVLEERYDLSRHKVIILPGAAYLSPVLSEKLLIWIKNGGTLICCGVPGVWNPYGQNDMSLVTRIFGNSEIQDLSGGKWKWDWKLLENKPEVQVFTEGKKTIGAVATYWGGKMLIATEDFRPAALQKLFYGELDHALGQKLFQCAANAFEVVLRDDGYGHRFLFVLNPSTRDIRKDEFTLPGNYSQCIDLGIGSGVPMSVTIGRGQTKFNLHLQPGEGTVIALKNN